MTTPKETTDKVLGAGVVGIVGSPSPSSTEEGVREKDIVKTPPPMFHRKFGFTVPESPTATKTIGKLSERMSGAGVVDSPSMSTQEEVSMAKIKRPCFQKPFQHSILSSLVTSSSEKITEKGSDARSSRETEAVGDVSPFVPVVDKVFSTKEVKSFFL